MTYRFKEVYTTIQGEGAQAGRVAVFARFAGCNLWSGREADRAGARCWFCDTEFRGTDGPGGGAFGTSLAAALMLRAEWDSSAGSGGLPYVVFTGGEPLLQLDDGLIRACHALGLEVGVETNGTIEAPPGIDWLCVSPKPSSELVQRSGDELKLVYPTGLDPADFVGLPFTHRFLQPLDGPDREANTVAVVDYCKRDPRWRLSVQAHKLIGLP